MYVYIWDHSPRTCSIVFVMLPRYSSVFKYNLKILFLRISITEVHIHAN